MAKKKDNDNFTYEIEDIVGIVRENDTHDWVKAVMLVAWGDNPITLDIRSINLKSKRIGKGISLTNEDTDRLVNILLENDYGSLEELENAVKRRRSFFTIEEKPIDIDECDDDGYYHIEIP